MNLTVLLVNSVKTILGNIWLNTVRARENYYT